ncbi:MAG: hypothetical protein AAGB15_13950 [Pseudomonadota bacterium]
MSSTGQVHVEEIQAEDAWNLLAIDEGAALVDVRPDHVAEADGAPDLAEIDRPVLHVPWLGGQLPSMRAHFAVHLEAALAKTPATHLIFYAQTGPDAAEAAESAAQALAHQGQSIDISVVAPGADAESWRAADLPWRS